MNPNFPVALPLAMVQVSIYSGIGWLTPFVDSHVKLFWHIKFEFTFHVVNQILYKTYVSIYQSKGLVTQNPNIHFVRGW